VRIAAVLCWYDEPPEFLERLACSLAGEVDLLISADGSWPLFPDGGPESPEEQRQALKEAAAAAGLTHRTVSPVPVQLWESQVQKRSILYGIAATHADWLLVVDGDEWIRSSRGLRARLETVTRDVCEVGMIRPGAEHLAIQRRRRLFRTSGGGLAVKETHNGVVDGAGRWLSGPRRVPLEPAADLTEALCLGHAFRSRGDRRDADTRRYYAARKRLRAEVH